MAHGPDRRRRCRPICWRSARLPALVEFAVRSFGGLDVLVNNASTFYATKVGEITPAAFDDLLGTNLKAPHVPLAGRRAGAAQVEAG